MREQQGFQQFVIRQRGGSCLDNALAQPAAVTVIMRTGRSGIPESWAVYLFAQGSDALFVARVEQPDQPPAIPCAAKLTRARREFRVIVAADRDLPVPLEDRQSHDAASEEGLPKVVLTIP